MSAKVDERSERDERRRAEKARAAQAKIERAEEERVESARQSERSRLFRELLGGSGKPKGCCEPCNYHIRTAEGEYQSCKMGHKDSGPGKEICNDCSEPHYRPKK